MFIRAMPPNPDLQLIGVRCLRWHHSFRSASVNGIVRSRLRVESKIPISPECKLAWPYAAAEEKHRSAESKSRFVELNRFLWREGGDDFLEARIAAQRVPLRIKT